MQRKLLFFGIVSMFLILSPLDAAELTPEQITATWKDGKTLPQSIFETYQLPATRPGNNDTGINVLIDLNRRCNFVWLWNYQSQFARNGFRVCGAQATLDTILGENPLCRVRVKTDDAEPFAWWVPPKFNVAIVRAGSPTQQQFLPEEVETLKKFVQDGGGLVIISETPRNENIANTWSFNTLLATFGAKALPESQQAEFGRSTVLQLSDDWEATLTGAEGGVVRAKRQFGKGRVLILESDSVLCNTQNVPRNAQTAETRRKEEETMTRQVELLRWVAEGKEPVGGSPTLPQARAGGGGIYPDQEMIADGIVAYYAKNQIPDLLKVVKEDLPKVTGLIYAWLPSQKPEEPVIFILSASSGGGWAVNVRLPKEVGIISDDRYGIIGIFAHEQAHTMRGPVNEKGGYGASPAHDLSGEAHAGWFQGKAWAMFYEKDQEKSNRDCNSILNDRNKFLAFDFVKHYQKDDPQFGKGYDWTKLWWVWQKLDDKYGPTWYPRWYWVRATRWQDQPNHRQSWDETVEDMSIAVGEDLFPFFKEIGTSLSKDRFTEVEFQGTILTLPIADIEISPGKNVNLTPIGDYTKPLR